MGERLMKYYKLISDEKGLAAKIKLAQLTRLPSTRAALAPDSPENLELFRQKASEILGRPAPRF